MPIAGAEVFYESLMDLMAFLCLKGRHVSNKNALHCLLSSRKALQKHFGGSFDILSCMHAKVQADD